MKKGKLLFMSLLVFFASILVVNAEEKLVCDKNTVEFGKSITCSYTIGDEARMIETDSDYLKLDSVSGNGNTQQNDHQAIFQSSGKISFIAKKSGKVDIYLSTENGIGSITTLPIKIIEPTTTKKTTTTTATTKAKSDNNYLESITVNGEKIESFDKTKTKYFVEVENKVKKATVKATCEDDSATVTIDGPKALEVGDNEYTISVKSESNTTKFYKVIVTRKDEEESSNTDIKSIKIRGYHLNFDKNSKTFYLNIKKEDTELDITVNTKDKKANYDIEGNENLEDGSVVKIVVTAQNGDTDTYRIIIRKESTNIIPYVIGVAILIIIIVIIIVFMKNKKKKDNDKEDNKDKKSNGKKETINKENKNNEAYENEKTIEMPPISKPIEKDNKKSYEEEYDDDLDDEMVHIDNDEEEETRILSYAEREKLEKARRQKEEEEQEDDTSDVSSKIDEELNKGLSFNYEYENDDEDDE